MHNFYIPKKKIQTEQVSKKSLSVTVSMFVYALLIVYQPSRASVETSGPKTFISAKEQLLTGLSSQTYTP